MVRVFAWSVLACAEALVKQGSQNSAVQGNITVGNHEWDCNCQGLYDVCSFTTCAYVTSCATGAQRLSWPNVHNESETLSAGAGSNPWHCNCAGTYSWCSYTTCYAHCDGSAEVAEDSLTAQTTAVALVEPDSKNLAVQDKITVGNHEWDCNCQGLFDVCSYTTCAYATSCATGAKRLSWPNVHNESETVSAGAGSNPWHCNCAGTYSWCSYTTCYAHCDGTAESDADSLMAQTAAVALVEPDSKNLAVQDKITVGNHEWDCNCQGLFDVCSYTTCAYVTSCATGAERLSWPNVHNESETVSAGAGSNPWHCNCAGTYSWCSYTTCYAHCDGSAEADADSLMPQTTAVALVEQDSKNLAVQDNITVGNHEWDCNCQGLFDVCSYTTCAYVTSCATGAERLSWPNVHNESETLSVGAGSNPWHCNCAGTYSWCSYTTCYAHCDGSAEADAVTSIVV